MSNGIVISDTTITGDQLEIIKKTIAEGATPEELQLYIYDCQRRGVHPLDRLLHFTKRGGKYTPVVSIDLMRSRADATGQYAGSDEPQYLGDAMSRNFKATVKVWRMVSGQRCDFTAVARWDEYKPTEGNDFMWKKMPYLMLGKCAEALALRKAFPQQLSGLYTHEEMDQAKELKIVEPVANGVPSIANLGANVKEIKEASLEPSITIKINQAIATLVQLEGASPIEIVRKYSGFDITDPKTGKKERREANSLERLIKPDKNGKLSWAETTYSRMLDAINKKDNEYVVTPPSNSDMIRDYEVPF